MIKLLKETKTTSDKKWLYNFAAHIIKLYKENKPYNKFSVSIQNYYKCHYENYHNEYYKNQDPIKKQKRIVEAIDYKREQGRILERKKTKLYKLYREGQLSEHSTEVIDKELKQLEIKNDTN